MALLMAAYHPEKFSAVSAWVPISDLSSWHAFHTRDGKPGNYARMMEKALSGPPGSHPEVDAQYHERSPIHHLDRAVGLPLHIHAGIHDGYTGSVPIDHSLKAYNVLAQAAGEEPIADDTIQALLAQGKLPPPSEPSEKFDALYEREIHFHRPLTSYLYFPCDKIPTRRFGREQILARLPTFVRLEELVLAQEHKNVLSARLRSATYRSRTIFTCVTNLIKRREVD